MNNGGMPICHEPVQTLHVKYPLTGNASIHRSISIHRQCQPARNVSPVSTDSPHRQCQPRTHIPAQPPPLSTHKGARLEEIETGAFDL